MVEMFFVNFFFVMRPNGKFVQNRRRLFLGTGTWVYFFGVIFSLTDSDGDCSWAPEPLGFFFLSFIFLSFFHAHFLKKIIGKKKIRKLSTTQYLFLARQMIIFSPYSPDDYIFSSLASKSSSVFPALFASIAS
jgi:hypothetical protein